MKAVVLEGPRRICMRDVESPVPKEPGEALVRVLAMGICGTDFHAYHGMQTFPNYPLIIGHELAVEIVWIADNEFGLFSGDLCTVEPYINCGYCVACRRGKTNCCVDLRVLGVHMDGGMREFIVIPVQKLHSSKVLSVDQLALVEMLSVGAHAVRRAELERGECVLVVGVGPIGLSVAQFACLSGARVIAMDINKKRLSFCAEALPVEKCIATDEQPLAQIKDVSAGDLPTVVFDCTGNLESMKASFGLVAHGGKIVLVGHCPGEITFSDRDFHVRELTLLGSRNATAQDFQKVIQHLEHGEINIADWTTHRARLSQVVEVFPRWAEPDTGVVKAIVEWDG